MHLPQFQNGDKLGVWLLRIMIVSYVLLLWAVMAYVCDLLANGI